MYLGCNVEHVNSVLTSANAILPVNSDRCEMLCCLYVKWQLSRDFESRDARFPFLAFEILPIFPLRHVGTAWLRRGSCFRIYLESPACSRASQPTSLPRASTRVTQQVVSTLHFNSRDAWFDSRLGLHYPGQFFSWVFSAFRGKCPRTVPRSLCDGVVLLSGAVPSGY